jgi:hypothetical protein
MSESQARDFRPELLSRSGEGTAWAFLAFTTVNLFVIQRWLGNIPLAAWVIWAFLLLAATLISFNNWVDRRTRLRLDIGGITYENGLRSVRLTWPEVQKMTRFPARWGQTIQVIGEKTSFVFHMLGEVRTKGELRGKVGFAEGEKIFEEIVAMSNLKQVSESNGVYYYSRQ